MCRPKAFSLKKNINFAIAPLFPFELNLSSIILSYLQYNKIPGFMTEEIFLGFVGFFACFLLFFFFWSLEFNNQSFSVSGFFLCLFFARGLQGSICSHGRKGEVWTLSKEAQIHDLQVRRVQQPYLLAHQYHQLQNLPTLWKPHPPDVMQYNGKPNISGLEARFSTLFAPMFHGVFRGPPAGTTGTL